MATPNPVLQRALMKLATSTGVKFPEAADAARGRRCCCGNSVCSCSDKPVVSKPVVSVGSSFAKVYTAQTNTVVLSGGGEAYAEQPGTIVGS
jgi:hypothetical protein